MCLLQVEVEEEFLTNTLQKKLEKVKKGSWLLAVSPGVRAAMLDAMFTARTRVCRARLQHCSATMHVGVAWCGISVHLMHCIVWLLNGLLTFQGWFSLMHPLTQQVLTSSVAVCSAQTLNLSFTAQQGKGGPGKQAGSRAGVCRQQAVQTGGPAETRALLQQAHP
jgi:hypothetical protein